MKESRGQGPEQEASGEKSQCDTQAESTEQQLEKTMYSRTWQTMWQLDQQDGKQACVRYDTVPV